MSPKMSNLLKAFGCLFAIVTLPLLIALTTFLLTGMPGGKMPAIWTCLLIHVWNRSCRINQRDRNDVAEVLHVFLRQMMVYSVIGYVVIILPDILCILSSAIVGLAIPVRWFIEQVIDSAGQTASQADHRRGRNRSSAATPHLSRINQRRECFAKGQATQGPSDFEFEPFVLPYRGRRS